MTEKEYNDVHLVTYYLPKTWITIQNVIDVDSTLLKNLVNMHKFTHSLLLVFYYKETNLIFITYNVCDIPKCIKFQR